eukprot:7322301-Prymnesium_polylepis.1
MAMRVTPVLGGMYTRDSPSSKQSDAYLRERAGDAGAACVRGERGQATQRARGERASDAACAGHA